MLDCHGCLGNAEGVGGCGCKEHMTRGTCSSSEACTATDTGGLGDGMSSCTSACGVSPTDGSTPSSNGTSPMSSCTSACRVSPTDGSTPSSNGTGPSCSGSRGAGGGSFGDGLSPGTCACNGTRLHCCSSSGGWPTSSGPCRSDMTLARLGAGLAGSNRWTGKRLLGTFVPKVCVPKTTSAIPCGPGANATTTSLKDWGSMEKSDGRWTRPWPSSLVGQVQLTGSPAVSCWVASQVLPLQPLPLQLQLVLLAPLGSGPCLEELHLTSTPSKSPSPP